MANNLDQQGKHAEGRPIHEKALAIRLRVFGEKHGDVVDSYKRLAENASRDRRNDESIAFTRKALEIADKIFGADHPQTIDLKGNLGLFLFYANQLTDSERFLVETKEAKIKAHGPDNENLAVTFNNLGLVYQDQGDLNKAEECYRESLRLSRTARGEIHPDTGASLTRLGEIELARGGLPKAVEYLESASRGYDATRVFVSERGVDRALFGRVVSPYPQLAVALARHNRPTDAWRAIERNASRGLTDELARDTRALSSDEKEQVLTIQRQLAEINGQIVQTALSAGGLAEDRRTRLDQLRTSRNKKQEEIAAIVTRAHGRRLADLQMVQKAIPNDAALIYWTDLTKLIGSEQWGCVVRRTGEPVWKRLPGTGKDEKWQTSDFELSFDLWRECAKKSATDSTWVEHAAMLKRIRLEPFEKELSGVKHLIVVPTGQMAGTPLELAAGGLMISYIPSGTFLANLKYVTRDGKGRLLAIGDPDFSDPASALNNLPPSGLLIAKVTPGGAADKAGLRDGDVVCTYAGNPISSYEEFSKLYVANREKSVEIEIWRSGQPKLIKQLLGAGPIGLTLHKEAARDVIAARRAKENSYVASRGSTLAELPGTRVEVNNLVALFGKESTVLFDSDANESALDELRLAGQLSKYRFIHFGTHGAADYAKAFESVVYLSRHKDSNQQIPERGKPVINGELTAREVLEHWKLDADLVTLSACETALGLEGGGDGLLGFTQAFLTAGARSVCLSLWKVDDTATCLLMTRFYQNLLGKRDGLAKPMPKAEALWEAKRWLRELSHEEAKRLTADITKGVTRGDRGKGAKLELVVPSGSKAETPAKDDKPFAHPRYWAAFILIGDPN